MNARRSLPLLGLGVALVLIGAAADVLVTAQTPPTAYTVVGLDTHRLLPFRTAGGTDLISLDQIAALFPIIVSEDRLAGGLTIAAQGQRIVLAAGQSLASVNGRVVSLSGPVVHDNSGWLVPVDLLSRVLGPALNVHIDVSRASHVIAIGAARLAHVTLHIDRRGPGIRVTVETDPPVAHHLSRNGSRLIVHFEAAAIDLAPLAGAAPDFVAGVHVDGTTVVLDLGTAVGGVTTNDDGDHLLVDLTPASVALTPPPQAPITPPVAAPLRAPSPPAPAPDQSAAGPIRTIVIDPGHGGDETGARGAAGTTEKDLVLQLARRLKSAIESRIGLHVVLTRDGDDTVPLDRRTALANANKADLLISLHANASFRAAPRGAQVLSIGADDYKTSQVRAPAPTDRVPVVSGGTRLIEAVPWELAQLPYLAQSAAVSAALLRHLAEHHVPLYSRPADLLPLRVLAGANMPAVLVEVGFLSNADDEHALTGDELPSALVDAMVDTIVELRHAASSAAPSPPGVPASR